MSDTAAVMTVRRTLNLADIQEHPRNYNKHPNWQLARLCQSLQRFGQLKPVVVWRNFIIAGNGVTMAARRLGWQSIEADLLPDDYPEELALEFMMADNLHAQNADPDQAALLALMDEAVERDREILAALGSDVQRLEQLRHTMFGESPIPEQVDLQVEWQGMPAFAQEDVFGAIHTIKVHFASQVDIDAFAKLTKQTVTNRTKSVWYPKQEHEPYSKVITHEP